MHPVCLEFPGITLIILGHGTNDLNLTSYLGFKKGLLTPT
jgi:hypothetical protein